MEKMIFVGVEKKTSKVGNKYYMLHFGKPIDEKYGCGCTSITSKIDEDEFKDFTDNCDIGTEFNASYEVVQNASGGYQFILKKYDFNV